MLQRTDEMTSALSGRPAVLERLHQELPGDTAQAEDIALAIVGRTRLYADSLNICISQTTGMEVTTCCTLGSECDLDALDAEVIILQHQASVYQTLGVLHSLRSAHADVALVVVDLPANTLCVLSYLEAGAVGYVYLHESMDQLLDVVRAARRGQPRLDGDLVEPLLARLVTLRHQLQQFQLMPDDPLPLSTREREIAEELVMGKTNAEIAAALYISPGTVKNHVHNILRKLGARDRKHASFIFRQLDEQASDDVLLGELAPQVAD